MPTRKAFSDVYRGQVIEVLIDCAPEETAQFTIHVKVTMHCKTPVPTINVCNRGYESLDEARHAGVLIGRDLIRSFIPDCVEASPPH